MKFNPLSRVLPLCACLIAVFVCFSAYAASPVRILRISSGMAAPLFLDKKSSPAFAVSIAGTTHYGYLESGTSPGRMTVRMPDNKVYSLSAPQPTGYVTNGLIVHLDAISGAVPGGTIWFDVSGHGNDFRFAGPQLPIFGPSSIVMNHINHFARSIRPLLFVGHDAVTVEIRYKIINPGRQSWAWEYTSSWNNQPGGFGLFNNHTCSAYQSNRCCTAQYDVGGLGMGRGTIRYDCEINDLEFHTMTKTFSSVPNPAGRLFYIDAALITSTINPNMTNVYANFSNDTFFLGYRDTERSAPNMEINSLRIYTRQLSAAEICQNAWTDYNRFGGAVPAC
ncbi:MAG: hypothetical protein FWE17_00175 [Alphaproteobacteria bacterium]|nr:hypothetical protein [Alphaproteobacteria bacterium]MCL2757821.1 hypothetical protein [Alphaproteobacteria bacterium]